jgi:hypothetical protein
MGVGNAASRHLDEVCVAVLQPERGGQKLNEPDVHAGKYRELFSRELVGLKRLIAPFCDKTFIVIEDFLYD